MVWAHAGSPRGELELGVLHFHVYSHTCRIVMPALVVLEHSEVAFAGDCVDFAVEGCGVD